MARRCAGEREGWDFKNSGRKRSSTSATVGRRRVSCGETQGRKILTLTRQALTKRLDQLSGVLPGLMGEVQINHGGIDLFVTEEVLNGVKACPTFDHVGGKTMAQAMRCCFGNIKLGAGQNNKPLKGPVRHRGGCRMHTGAKFGSLLDPATRVGENEKRIAMVSVVFAQVLEHIRGNGNHAVLESLALSDEEFSFLALDVMDGEREAFGQPKPAAVEEFYGNAVATQTDFAEQLTDLLTGEHDGQCLGILGSDLREHLPRFALKEVVEEGFQASHGLAHRIGFPVLLELEKQEVLAELIFGEHHRITVEVPLDEAKLAVVGVTSAVAIVAQGKKLGVAGHGVVGMVVTERVGQYPMPKRAVGCGGLRCCGF